MKIITIKTIGLIATIGSALCVISTLIQHDWTEAMAWSLVTFFNIRDFLIFKNKLI